MDAFAWLGQLMEWFGNFVPRLVIVKSTDKGVRFRRGKHVIPIEPGLVMYWPLTTEIHIAPVVRQTHNMAMQTVTTKDNHPVIVGGVVVYTITDIVRAYTKNWEVESTIDDIAQVTLAELVREHDFKCLQSRAFQRALTRKMKDELREFGISVQRAALTDCAITYVLRTVGG